jgi:hypothetical protein
MHRIRHLAAQVGRDRLAVDDVCGHDHPNHGAENRFAIIRLKYVGVDVADNDVLEQ